MQITGVAPHREPGVEAQPPLTYDLDLSPEKWRKTHALWNGQMGFDEKIHESRNLLYPQDLPPGPAQDQCRLQWVWGQAFAILQEIDELREAKRAGNGDEETVDVLHFTMSLANKLGMTAEELGHFETLFEEGRNRMYQKYAADFREVFHGELEWFLKDLSDLIGNSFKWWKDHKAPVDFKPFKEALKLLHGRNIRLATTVFDDAEAMYDYYMVKVDENHQRQAGEIEGREDYQSVA